MLVVVRGVLAEGRSLDEVKAEVAASKMGERLAAARADAKSRAEEPLMAHATPDAKGKVDEVFNAASAPEAAASSGPRLTGKYSRKKTKELQSRSLKDLKAAAEGVEGNADGAAAEEQGSERAAFLARRAELREAEKAEETITMQASAETD